MEDPAYSNQRRSTVLRVIRLRPCWAYHNSLERPLKSLLARRLSHFIGAQLGRSSALTQGDRR
jgi:hypothetical protein